MNKARFQLLANKTYEAFEDMGATVEQVAQSIEQQLADAKEQVKFFTALRNDVSTHMGPITDKFNRERHMHRFAICHFPD